MNKTIILSVIIALLFACDVPEEPEFDNPLDPDVDITYISPKMVFTQTPGNGIVLETETIELSWEGNETATEFAWLLDDDTEKIWSGDLSLKLEYLDEGQHRLTFFCRNEVEVEGDMSLSLDFTVDAVKGPALMFEHRRIFVQQNEMFSINIYLEEVSELMGLSFELPFNSEELEFQSCEILPEISNIMKSGGAEIWDVIEQKEGMLMVDITRMITPRSGTDGSGPVLTLNFRFTGNSSIELAMDSNAQFADNDLTPHPFNQIIPLIVEYAD